MVQLRALRGHPEPETGDLSLGTKDLAALEAIQQRVLWLATRMVHEANSVRPNLDQSKIGGHQASSASVVSILTALYFAWLRDGDRVAVKPHGSPAFHAVQYLLGNLDKRYLPKLRDFDGIQAYPSRTKDPDPVDIPTGSVGLGSAATLFAALADRYAELHFGGEPGRARRRFVALLGDAELDEGNIWEAVTDATIASAKLGNVLWIVDLNRQSLDRIVPGIHAGRLEDLFVAAGWRVLEAKYGRKLKAAFAGPGGVALRRRVDDMANEEYQSLVRLPGGAARQQLLDGASPSVRGALAQSVAETPDAALPELLADLGGHDLAELIAGFETADAEPDRPTILFAYTMKGWGLPIAGDPLNHSALLTQAQLDEVARQLGIDATDEWAAFPAGSAEARVCREAAERLYPRGPRPPIPPLPLTGDDVPATLATRVAATVSSQEAFGNALLELGRTGGPLAQRMVTASPDVAVSTNLGGWINRLGVFSVDEAVTAANEAPRLLRWQPGPRGQHIELGIAEINLFLLLGQLGLSYELNDELLLPVGTVYDPFVCRGLDALIYGVYSGAKFVFAGTPSGVSLSPEGGAHQSSITVSIGLELPQVQLFEPCFVRETEWCLLEGLRHCLDRKAGLSTYLRLTTKSVDQSLMEPALTRLGEEELRRQVLAGGYRLVEPERLDGAPRVLIATAGAMVPEAVAAAQELHAEGIAAVVLNLTGLSRLYRGWTGAQLRSVRGGRSVAASHHLAQLIPEAERTAPIVTIMDGASHALSFLGAVFGQRVVPLGVDEFGRSGTRAAVYDYAGIDAAHIVNAAVAASPGPHPER